MKNWSGVIFCLLCLAMSAAAQDPLKVLPKNYQLEFENDWVKVMRVHYGPHETLPVHDHAETGAAYVYLNDSGKVVYKHIGLSYGAVTRPPVRAGSFRLYKAVKEVHEVENLGDTPSDFLRVEFKTEPLNDNTLRGRYYREDYPAGENYQKVQFDNEQIRVTRLICVPGKSCDGLSGADQPALLVALTSANFKSAGREKRVSLAPGGVLWRAAGQKAVMENSGTQPAELLRFDLKTKPMKTPPEGRNETHGHPHN